MQLQRLATCVALALGACANGGNSLAPNRVAPGLLNLRLEAGTPIEYGNDSRTTIRVDVNAVLRERLCTTRRAHQTQNDGDGDQGEGQQSPCPDRYENDQAEFNYLASRLSISAELDESARRDVRNDVLTQLIHASNTNCRTYLWGLRGTQVGSRLASDIFTTTLGVAGTLNGHLPTAQLLSGLSSLTSSTGTSVDRAVFAEAGVEIIADQVIRMRERSRRDLERRMTEPYGRYPIGLALADVSDYHQDCSIMRGLTQMQDAVRTREEAVRLSRYTAQRVLERGGDGQQVAAAVAGVADVYLGLDHASYGPVAPMSTQALNHAPDLDELRRRVMGAMPENGSVARAKEALSQLLNPPLTDPCPASAGGETQPPPIPQRERFIRAALASMCEAGDENEYGEARRVALREIDAIREEIVSVRVTGAEQVRLLGESGADYDVVVAAITRMRGAQDAPYSYYDDRILSIMAQAAAGVAGPDQSGATAAHVAIASANAVNLSYQPRSAESAPPPQQQPEQHPQPSQEP